MLHSIGLMLNFLSYCESTNDPKTNSQRDFVKKILKKHLPEVIKWMDKNVFNWLHYMEKVLGASFSYNSNENNLKND